VLHFVKEWNAMPANEFVLQGSGVEVDYYTIGANPALPALVYKVIHGRFQITSTLSLYQQK
jgi:hypothetical protein